MLKTSILDYEKNEHCDISFLFHKLSPCIKQTVSEVLKRFQCGKNLVAYVLNMCVTLTE